MDTKQKRILIAGGALVVLLTGIAIYVNSGKTATLTKEDQANVAAIQEQQEEAAKANPPVKFIEPTVKPAKGVREVSP